jgi:hypothetical protein
MPLPVREIPSGLCRSLEFVFTDIDDTITTGGLLPDGAYSALWDLYRAGIRVVPVTGRPAGWCDHIARMWPVEGVIGENGAFYFIYDRKTKKMRREYAQPEEERRRGLAALERIRRETLLEVPGSAVAADQAYRIADLAIDFREDVPPLDETAVDRICLIARRNGAVCKVSSIHVNCWYGDYDKIACLKKFLDREFGMTVEDSRERMIFIGDSPNDEPSFREIYHSVGVANIRKFLHRLAYPPRYITNNEAAEGFSETAEIILVHRKSGPRQP